MTTLHEPILSDNDAIDSNLHYVADGRVVTSNYHGITVREFKARVGAREIRRCDLMGRMDAERAKEAA